MSSAPARWVLRTVTVQDILGYQGEWTFAFEDGLHVIEASNHTGKTSLSFALLWGLTGQIPGLARINGQTFRLDNKHAGDNALPSVTIRLVSAGGKSMEIRRRYEGRKRAGEPAVDVTLGSEEWSGNEAETRIFHELGAKTTSLEGCGVVLQDFRLRLVTGRAADISEVINDMLGLQALSEVVPSIQDAAKRADQKRKEMAEFLDGANPIRRWEEEDARLQQAHRELEDAAIKAGFDPRELENPSAHVGAELSQLSSALEVPAPGSGVPAAAEVERLRRALSEKRKSSPVSRDLASAGEQRTRVERLARDAASLADRWRLHSEALNVMGGKAEEALVEELAGAGSTLDRNQRRREDLEGEQQVLEVVYSHLLVHPDATACPVCEQAISSGVLQGSVRARLDSRLAAELESLASSDQQARTAKAFAKKQLDELRELKVVHSQLMRSAAELRSRAAEAGTRSAELQKDEDLLNKPAAREVMTKSLSGMAASLEASVLVEKAREDEARAALQRQEEEVFQPIDRRINRVRDVLIPLDTAAQNLEQHGLKRESAHKRAGALEALIGEAKELATHLKRLAGEVSDAELERATSAIRACLPTVSSFFARVAENPDYDGLDITPEVSRDKVVYRLRATSSRVAALDDAVGHVLSEGDLSAAGMALLLGLAQGDAHRMGFLVLDDPGQGMDPVLQANLARELGSNSRMSQVIVLTHQPELAAALEASGGTRSNLGRWKGGDYMPGMPEMLSLEVKTTRSQQFQLSERDIEGIGEQGFLLALITDRRLKGPRWTMVPARHLTAGGLSPEQLAQDGIANDLVAALNQGWSNWILDGEAWGHLVGGGLDGLRERIEWCRTHHPPHSNSSTGNLREGRIASALAERQVGIDLIVQGVNAAQKEGNLHQALVEDVLREMGYDILPNPVGVPDIRALLRGPRSSRSSRQRIEQWTPSSARLAGIREQLLALPPEELEETRRALGAT